MATEFDQKFTQFWVTRKWLHKYFGYQEDWVTIPMSDERDKWWFIRGAKDDTGAGGEVVMEYQPEPFDIKDVEDGNCVSWNIYTQRFLPKWVFRGKDFTMISCATGVDGNKYLGIFSNDHEVPKELLDPNAKTTDEEIHEEMIRRGHVDAS